MIVFVIVIMKNMKKLFENIYLYMYILYNSVYPCFYPIRFNSKFEIKPFRIRVITYMDSLLTAILFTHSTLFLTRKKSLGWMTMMRLEVRIPCVGRQPRSVLPVPSLQNLRWP